MFQAFSWIFFFHHSERWKVQGIDQRFLFPFAQTRVSPTLICVVLVAVSATFPSGFSESIMQPKRPLSQHWRQTETL